MAYERLKEKSAEAFKHYSGVKPETFETIPVPLRSQGTLLEVLRIAERNKKKPGRSSNLSPVERTLAWFLKYRRLSVDYKRMPQTGESFMEIAMIRLMVRRLAAKSEDSS